MQLGYGSHFDWAGAAKRSCKVCISSSAAMICASGNSRHRRSCSRRDPSQVVRLQSMSTSFRGTVVSIVILHNHSQVLDIYQILRSAGNGLHRNQRIGRNESDNNRVVERLLQGAGVFALEIERFSHEHID
ncbi:MAG TPA: hypothetical protein P5528_01195, partial [Steroidobacteraceae bacterium]|nr:hypothetical protein [Steroidobacteraceae bacterium]